jgi:P-type conjugative transfer protein TrbJ
LQLPANIWQDVTGVMSQLQNLLKSARSLTFAAALDFEKFAQQHPGFRDLTAGSLDFAQIYKERLTNWQKYAEGVLEANNIAVSDVKNSQSLIEKLNDASKNSVGQMQALQAGNQIATFMSQELAQMRIDIARQIDLQTEIALNEQQAKADEEAAFEQAIGQWTPDSAPEKR